MDMDGDPKVMYATPLRESLRQWLKEEAARRRMRMQDLVEEIVGDARSARPEHGEQG